ncbi:hypothetical protein PENSPDRAFT_755957 [Peniophora sp. CONT]|nr:hypothetical protein PENSPDRAFT_755957 [Peniophora sp. CONT]
MYRRMRAFHTAGRHPSYLQHILHTLIYHPQDMSNQGQEKENEVGAVIRRGQGIFIQKDSTVFENIYVSVTKTDVSKGTSVWYDTSSEDPGIVWTALSRSFTQSTSFKRTGGWEAVVFRNESDTKRKVLYFNVKSGSKAQSNNITFCGWYDNGIVIQEVPN